MGEHKLLCKVSLTEYAEIYDYIADPFVIQIYDPCDTAAITMTE